MAPLSHRYGHYVCNRDGAKARMLATGDSDNIELLRTDHVCGRTAVPE
jgi:hypothetical protein